MIRVLVAENSSINTRLLADALKRDPGLQVTPFESSPAALVAAASTENIDVVVLSSTLDEEPSRGLAVLRQLHAVRPDIRAVVLPDLSKDEAVLDAFRAGARGVFRRNEPIELLSECVRSVHAGNIWASQHDLVIAVGALANSLTVRAVNANGMSLLSERELQVVRGLAEGLSNREIADRLQLSQHTVKNYLFRVFDKLGVSSRVELLSMTLSQGFADPALPERAAEEDNQCNGYSQDELVLLRKSAEAGLPAAQLALAQLHLCRRAGPEDLIDGYMWYLVATERALQSRELVMKLLTPRQIEEATRRATVWLPRGKRPRLGSAVSRPEPMRSIAQNKPEILM